VDFSGMGSREKTLIVVLGVIIIIALVGIGILAAKLLVGDGGEQAAGITPPAATEETLPLSAATATLEQESPASAGGQPVRVVSEPSPSGRLPAILMDQPLRGDRSYRVEIVTEDGSSIDIRGSWRQKAKSASGDLELALPESIDAKTPFSLDLTPPVDSPREWSVSISASAKDLVPEPPRLVITIWDVTGIE
jgi:hypothetical protein